LSVDKHPPSLRLPRIPNQSQPHSSRDLYLACVCFDVIDLSTFDPSSRKSLSPVAPCRLVDIQPQPRVEKREMAQRAVLPLHGAQAAGSTALPAQQHPAVQDGQVVVIGQKRPLVTDQFDIFAPGGVHQLFRRLKTTRKHVARGQRCSACRKTRKKCDGSRPCSRCTGSGITCTDPVDGGAEAGEEEQDEGGVSRALLSAKTITVDRPVPFPDIMTFVNPPGDDSQGTAERGILTKFLVFGWSQAETTSMFNSLPPKLRRALVLLSDAMDGRLSRDDSVAAQRPMIPESNQSWWSESTSCCHMAMRYATNGLTTSVGINKHMATAMGGHTEEVLTRMWKGDLPLLSSQYRLLCQSLDWFLASLGHEPSRVFFHACAANQLAESTAMSLERYTATFYADGVTFTSVDVTPEEYDRATQAAPHVKGTFIECSRSAAELLQFTDLREKESIGAMVRSAEGRRRLDRLAHRVLQCFEIEDPP